MQLMVDIEADLCPGDLHHLRPGLRPVLDPNRSRVPGGTVHQVQPAQTPDRASSTTPGPRKEGSPNHPRTRTTEALESIRLAPQHQQGGDE